MLTYTPGTSIAHRCDPRAKLAVQLGVAFAAFSHPTPRRLSILTGITVLVLVAASVSPLVAVREIRYALPFILAGPLFSTVSVRPPWIVPAEAVTPALASYRVLLVLLVTVAYVRTTPVRDSRAAIQHVVPGRIGRILGVSVALVIRFVPVLLADLSQTRKAMRARLGTERRLSRRMEIIASGGVNRTLERADRLGMALRARCFAWNPTLPALHLSLRDIPVLALAVGLIGWTLL